MIAKCQGCDKLKEVKEYTWFFSKDKATKDTGVIDCCEDCKKSMEFSGYKLEEDK